MSWKACVTLILSSPLAVAALCGYFGHKTAMKVIYRSEATLMVPFLSAGIFGYLGYLAAKSMVKSSRNAPTNPNGPCRDVVDSSIMVQIPLIFVCLGGIVGLGIDLGLFAKWAFWG